MATIKTDEIEVSLIKVWDEDAVRQMCIANELYTRGNCAEYDAMFRYVRTHNPTLKNLAIVAKDIYDHSNTPITYTTILHLLDSTVMRCYSVSEESGLE